MIEFKVPEVRDYGSELFIGLEFDGRILLCVVTRISVRLTLADCARGIGAQEARNSGKKTPASIEFVCGAEPNVLNGNNMQGRALYARIAECSSLSVYA